MARLEANRSVTTDKRLLTRELAGGSVRTGRLIDEKIDAGGM